jgi:2-phospho-L-lactate guanylyltransferase
VKAILIPVKSFAQSKTRLAPYFSAEARLGLAAALCADFFAVVARVRCVDRVFVASREGQALERARAQGWETIAETEQISESHSVDAASRICAAQGVSALLRIPMDLPLATADDIDGILREAKDEPSAVLVPSWDGTGTNGLLRSPPTLFPSHFGPNSFALHLAEAKECGAQVTIMRNSRIERDVDEWDDLDAIARQVRAGSELARWMARHSLAPLGGERVSGTNPSPRGG